MSIPQAFERELPLRVLICDADQGTATLLSQSFKIQRGILDVQVTTELRGARECVTARNINAIFIDPISLGLDDASQFVFNLRRTTPGIVFVLFVDRQLVEGRRKEFYEGERRRFLHYYEIDKCTPTASFTDEVTATISECRTYLKSEISANKIEQLRLEAEHLAGTHPSVAETQLLAQIYEIRNLLASNMQSKRPAVRPNTVFLSFRLKEHEFATGLSDLLRESGFEVVTGTKANTYISRAILERIATCEYFVSLMTRDSQKTDGTYTTSAWLLEEKGAALALGKRIVLMVENGVSEIGGLQGDWQRIEFGERSFVTAALQAVDQLKSYSGTPGDPMKGGHIR